MVEDVFVFAENTTDANKVKHKGFSRCLTISSVSSFLKGLGEIEC